MVLRLWFLDRHVRDYPRGFAQSGRAGAGPDPNPFGLDSHRSPTFPDISRVDRPGVKSTTSASGSVTDLEDGGDIRPSPYEKVDLGNSRSFSQTVLYEPEEDEFTSLHPPSATGRSPKLLRQEVGGIRPRRGQRLVRGRIRRNGFAAVAGPGLQKVLFPAASLKNRVASTTTSIRASPSIFSATPSRRSPSPSRRPSRSANSSTSPPPPLQRTRWSSGISSIFRPSTFRWSFPERPIP
jgi:hypothetical protein